MTGMANKDLRQSIRTLSVVLRDLHHVLVQIEKDEYIRQYSGIDGTADLLDLLIQHPHFSWLHGLSETIVALDELASAKDEVDETTAGEARAIVENLLGKPGAAEDAVPIERLVEFMQKEPRVAMAYADVSTHLKTMPENGAVTTSEKLHDRHRRFEAKQHRAVGKPGPDDD